MMDAAPQPGTNPMMQGQPQMPMDMGQGQPAPMPQPPPEDHTEEYDMDKALQSMNIAEVMRKHDERKGTNKLVEIGTKVCKEFDSDESSRGVWKERNEKWMKLATQVVEKKTFPWDGAANIKYPLLTQAALQFSARAFPSLVPSLDIVKAKVIGPDQDGTLTEAANALSTHMSYQILYEMEDWEEDMDTLCFVLPIVGVMFKKTYYSEIQQKNVSELVHAKDFVVNYYTKSLKRSSRYTHVLYLTANEIKERQNFDLFLTYDEDFIQGKPEDRSYSQGETTGTQPVSDDEETPRKVLEQYRLLDLDEDGYKEPYIVTVDYDTKRVLRISPNFVSKGVDKDEDGSVRCITACSWFTKYGFLPNPDGGFYDLGFGLMLGGINEAINTLSNQMLDSGTLNNLNAGFIAKGLRIDRKELRLKAGEWVPVNAIGDDLRKNIVPLPANPPSPVLFELLGSFAQAGKETASIADIFTGKMPGQNTPAATTMATIEQGLKVFTSIYKRLYRSMQQEFQKLFDLNKLYMPNEVVKFTSDVNGESNEYAVSKHQYQTSEVKIMPAADPNMVSETQKLLKIQGLQEAIQYGHINPEVMTRQMLVYQGQDQIQQLMQMPPPQDPLEVVMLKMELADKDKDRQLEAFKLHSEHMKRQSEIALNMAKAAATGNDQEVLMLEQQLMREESQMEMHTKMMKMFFKQEEHQMDMQHEADMHEVKKTTAMAQAATDIQVSKAVGGAKVQEAQAMGSIKVNQAKQMGDTKLDHNKKIGDQKVAQAKAQAKVKPKAATKK